MNTSLLTVSPSPHVHTELSTPKVMRGVIYAMLPALAVGIFNFGLASVWVTAWAVASCVAFEHLITVYMLKRPTAIKDGSAIITGLLLAFNVPSSLPWYIVVLGSAVAIGIGKMTFGGLGNNPFNPALVGRVFLLISFPVQMTNWPVPLLASGVDGVTGATALGVIKEGLRQGQSIVDLTNDLPSVWQMFVGFQGGSLGEMSALALLLGMGYMLYRKIITWHTPIAMLGSVFIVSAIFWFADPSQFANPIFHLLSGGVLLGAVFMATDYASSPFTHKGMIIYGIGIGVITMIIRLFGAYPEGVSFAILIMNGFVPLINKISKPRRFGH